MFVDETNSAYDGEWWLKLLTACLKLAGADNSHNEMSVFLTARSAADGAVLHAIAWPVVFT